VEGSLYRLAGVEDLDDMMDLVNEEQEQAFAFAFAFDRAWAWAWVTPSPYWVQHASSAEMV